VPDAGLEVAGNLVLFQKRVAGLTEVALSRFVARARRAAGLKGMVDVLITSNAEMKILNRRFRGKNQATDVLSFPAGAEDPRKKFAGEIAVSAEIAAQNARALGHLPAQEAKILVLHGILHLQGYDHERDDGQMARRENQLRIGLGLPSGLIERTLDTPGEGGGRATRVRRDRPPSARQRRHS
jgi:probable rRNA maturation factor